MNPVERLLEDHARLLRTIEEIFLLLDAAERAEAKERDSAMTQILPKIQREFLALLKAHERLEEGVFSRLSQAGHEALPCDEIAAQHESINDIFRCVSALVNLKDPRNIYSIRFAMSRIRETLVEHFKFEENRVFPKLPSIDSAQPQLKEV